MKEESHKEEPAALRSVETIGGDREVRGGGRSEEQKNE